MPKGRVEYIRRNTQGNLDSQGMRGLVSQKKDYCSRIPLGIVHYVPRVVLYTTDTTTLVVN